MNRPPQPYPGLRPFNRNEADVFCGRSQHRVELLAKLQASRFLAVVGASGSGKSSLVMAGLWRDIEEGMLMSVSAAGSRFIYFKPGLNPYGSLAAAMADALAADPAATEGALRHSALGFAGALEIARARAPANTSFPETIVVIADQFEELFRFAALRQDETEAEKFREARDHRPLLDGTHNEAQAFIDLLVETARVPERRVYVVLTMRSEFIPRCEAFDRLPRAISANQYLTPRLRRDQLEAAILGPLKYFDMTVDEELTTLILNDLTQEQDHLPVLQHLLARLWRQAGIARPGDRRLRLQDYVDVGGTTDALNLHGDDILLNVANDPRGTAEPAEVGRFFCCLAEFDPTGLAIRRPRTVAQIAEESGLSPGKVRIIADHFRAPENNWLTHAPPRKTGEDLSAGDVLDLSHESLLRKWNLLSADKNGWMATERTRRDALLRLRDRMSETGWSKDSFAEGPGRLGRWAVRWFNTPVTWLQYRRLRDALHRDAEPTEAWARRYGWSWRWTRKFLQAIRVRAAAKWALIGNMVATVVALVVYALFLEADNARYQGQMRISELESAQAKSKQLASEKYAKLSEENQRSRIELLENENISRVAEIEENNRTLVEVQKARNQAANVATAASGFVSAPHNPSEAIEKLRLALRENGWPTAPASTPAPTSSDYLHGAVVFNAHDKPVSAVTFLKIDGLLNIVTGAGDDSVKLWSLDGKRGRVIIPHDGASLRTSGSQLFAVGNDATVRVWSAPDRVEERVLPAPAQGEIVVCTQPLPDGRLVFGTSAGRVGWWWPDPPVPTPRPKPFLLPTEGSSIINSLDFRPPDWLLTSADDGKVSFWRIPPSDKAILLGEARYDAPARGAAFDPLGQLVLVPCGTKQAALYRLDLDKAAPGHNLFLDPGRYTLPHQAPVVVGSFDPTGNLAATADTQGKVYLWQLADVRSDKALKGTLEPTVLSGHSRRVTALKWSPDGAFLATSDVGGLTIVWQNPAKRALNQDNDLPLVLPGHTDAVTSLAVSPDGNFLASGGADKTVCVVPLHPTFAGRGRVDFGGPSDTGLKDREGLSLLNENDVKTKAYESLFLPATSSSARSGLARRLDPTRFYVSAAWDFSLTSRNFLRNNKVLVRNPLNGREERAQAVDWGPYPASGYVADLSPGLGARLGLQQGDQVVVTVDLINPAGE